MTDAPTPQKLKQFKSALLAAQNWWGEMGVDIPSVPVSAKVQPKSIQKQQPKKTTAQHLAKPKPPNTAEAIAKITAMAKAATSLDALKTVIGEVDAGVLSDHARNIVFARGTDTADIMLIGEAPGRQEDECGKPFIGQTGQLLDNMLAAIGLSQTNTYITNVCNWRPPGNRNPSEEELNLCAPLITRHMELIEPKIVIIVGGVSLQALTGKTGIMKTRGRWQELDIAGQKTPAMPLYHPAFLLRRPELKKQAWHDLLLIKQKLENGHK
ncbi:MAG: uracil-DNA glycosylase [Robiginitomaculum sp.]